MGIAAVSLVKPAPLLRPKIGKLDSVVQSGATGPSIRGQQRRPRRHDTVHVGAQRDEVKNHFGGDAPRLVERPEANQPTHQARGRYCLGP